MTKKSEILNLKHNSCHLLFVIWIAFVICALLFIVDSSYAKEITIIYTGDTHAMLYTCSCPIEKDGGVARRATLIKQLKKKNPNTLVIDSGRFFAGGVTDEYTQSTELDLRRSEIDLKAMELIRYDAVGISDDEFNFGKDFLQKNVEKTKLSFISCNLKMPEVSPYIIKEIAGLRLGIIGLTPLSAAQKSQGTQISVPRDALQQAIDELKKQKVDLLILLSALEEQESLSLIKAFPQISILILSRSHTKEDNSSRIGSTLVLKPYWQGRRVSVADLTIEDNKIKDYRVNELRLSEKISDDRTILTMLPACFSDANCNKEGLIGNCQNPGNLNARCLFNEPAQVSLQVIMPKSCRVCDTDKVVNSLKKIFPGISTSYLYYPQAKSEKIIADLGIKGLPVYLLGKEVEKESGFNNLKNVLEEKGNFYMLKPEAGGISYFINRKAVPGKFDLFISLYEKDASLVLEATKEFNPQIHFLAVADQYRFDAKGGQLEVEEYLRAACVQKYYPAHFWSYITCRAANINSSWWEDCLGDFDATKIKNCARQKEGKDLLMDNIGLNKEAEVMFGPTYLLDNQEIFSSSGAPNKEELRKIINKRR